MAVNEGDAYCRNCGELLYRILRRGDGTTAIKDPSVEPASNGIQKFFRCPTCRGKTLRC
jgi:hypothetical protein